MELVVKKYAVKPIEFNYEELKKQTQNKLEKYKDLVFTEETMKEGKKTRAKLNNIKKDFEDRRKAVKKEINAPYLIFEAKIKELVALIDKPILAIDSQIKIFEDAKKQKKSEDITDVYEQIIGDLKEVLPLEKIFNPKWLNATVTVKTVATEISVIVKKTEEDLKVIDTLNSEFTVEIKNNYLNNLDLSKALGLKAELEERKKALEERQKQQEPKFMPRVVSPTAPPKEEKLVEQAPAKKEKVYSFKIEVTTTVEKKELFKKFLIENNIQFKAL